MSDLKIPQVGEYIRNVGKLIKVEDELPAPPPPTKDYIFEDIEAKCELYLKSNGELLDKLGTINDFYGRETSVTTAIEEMKEYAKKRNITKDSELEVRVTKVVSLTRMKPINQEAFYAKGYRDFQSREWGSKYQLPDPVETIVWSSKNEE
jgi:hypothetical protein